MFIEPNFIWNGIPSENKFLTIITTDNEIVNNIGIPYSKTLNKEEGFDIFTEEDSDTEEIVLNLCLEKDGVPIEWSPEIFNDIKNWLCTDDFGEFISMDNPNYIYYFKCTKIQKKFTFNNEGWIEVTFKPLNHYAYKRVIIEKEVRGKEIININNECNVEYAPFIEIENLCKNSRQIKVNDLIISDINPYEVVKIDNHMFTVLNGNDEDIFYKCNREWIALKEGENQIVVEGDCNITIRCEFPNII